MHRGLTSITGPEAAEVCYRCRAFRNGMINQTCSGSATEFVW